MTYIKTNMKPRFFPCIALIFCLTCGVLYADVEASEVIQIPTIDYPPLMGNRGGLMNDIVRESFNRAGIEVKFEILPMARIIWVATHDKAPAVLGSAEWFNREKAGKNLPRVTIGYMSFHFFYLTSRFPEKVSFEKLPDMAGYKIGYIRGGALTELLKNAGIEPDWVSNLSQNVKKLYAGRIDMFVASTHIGFSAMDTARPGQQNSVTMIEKPIKTVYGHIIFSNNQDALKQEFEKGFKIIRDDGTYLEIYKKYMKVQKAPERIKIYIRDGFPGE